MANPTNDHQFAYPFFEEINARYFAQQGLTKRELFAAMAMQGWLAGCGNAYSEFTGPAAVPHIAAESAVKFADALLAALSQTHE